MKWRRQSHELGKKSLPTRHRLNARESKIGDHKFMMHNVPMFWVCKREFTNVFEYKSRELRTPYKSKYEDFTTHMRFRDAFEVCRSLSKPHATQSPWSGSRDTYVPKRVFKLSRGLEGVIPILFIKKIMFITHTPILLASPTITIISCSGESWALL